MRLRKIDKGRYSLYLTKDFENQIRVEVSRSYNFGIGWGFQKHEQEIMLSLYCFKLFSLYITLELKRFKYRADELETCFVWDPKASVIRIQLLSQRGMDSSKPAVIDKWWRYNDFFLGRAVYSEGNHQKSQYVLDMPEGKYNVMLDGYTSYWHRPRSPFVKSLDRVEIIPDRPVPIPGKGENSWDMDDDAIHNSTEPLKGRTTSQILADFKEHVFDRRERYGGSRDWQPSKPETKTGNSTAETHKIAVKNGDEN